MPNPLAMPQRLLQIKQQSARLAELRCMQAAANLERARGAQDAALARLQRAEEAARSRCRSARLVEQLEATRQEILRLTEAYARALADTEAAREEYRDAVRHRQQVDSEIEVLEKLLERRRAEIERRAEQRKQQFADEWVLRRWNAAETG